jgi:hypothetical protein
MIARVVRKKTTKLAATDEGADVTASNRRRDPHRWSVPRIVKVLEKEMVGAEITGLQGGAQRRLPVREYARGATVQPDRYAARMTRHATQERRWRSLRSSGY